MSTSENTELSGLMLQAGEIDGQLQAQTPEAKHEAQLQVEAVTLADANVRGVGMVLDIAIPVLSKLYPSLVDVYTAETCGAVAQSLGPVLAKYGINIAEWGGRYQEEIGAVMVCGPVAWATVQGIKADIAARVGEAKAVAAKPAEGLLKAPAPTAPAKDLKPGDFGYVEAMEAGLVGA